MWKRMLLVLFTFAACVGLPARAQTQSGWEFSYTGFQEAGTGRFDPGYRLNGFFRGSDVDGDGAIGRLELSGFILAYYDYFAVPGTGCYDAWCWLNDFRYDLRTGQLSFDAESHYFGDAMTVSTRTVSGRDIATHEERGYSPPFVTSDSVWQWTDQTRFAISPPPVDEPPMLALLPAGLLLGAALVRMRARSLLKAPR